MLQTQGLKDFICKDSPILLARQEEEAGEQSEAAQDRNAPTITSQCCNDVETEKC